MCLVIVWVSAVPSKANAATKTHVIVFGKWTTAQWLPEADNGKPQALKIRALIVDGRVKEYVLGSPHDVTERLFVVQRVFRINDSLPEDTGNPRWIWQRGGWLLIDRVSGKVSAINLPDFDALYSIVSWYRDYAAYCGISDDGRKAYAIVAQLSHRKPVLKKTLAGNNAGENAESDTACPAPGWQRSPARVSFDPSGDTKETFAVRGHIVDIVPNDDEEDAEGSK